MFLVPSAASTLLELSERLTDVVFTVFSAASIDDDEFESEREEPLNAPSWDESREDKLLNQDDWVEKWLDDAWYVVMAALAVVSAPSMLDEEFEIDRLLVLIAFSAASTLELELERSIEFPPPPTIVALTAFIAASMLEEDFERLSDDVWFAEIAALLFVSEESKFVDWPIAQATCALATARSLSMDCDELERLKELVCWADI